MSRLRDMREHLPCDKVSIHLASHSNRVLLRRAAASFTSLTREQQRVENRRSDGDPELALELIHARRQLAMSFGRMLTHLTIENDPQYQAPSPNQASPVQSLAELPISPVPQQMQISLNNSAHRANAIISHPDVELRNINRASSLEAKNQHPVIQDDILAELALGLAHLKSLEDSSNYVIICLTHVGVSDPIDPSLQAAERLPTAVSRWRWSRWSNYRLKVRLEDCGGTSRWCTVIIGVIILLALIGYLISLAK